MIISQGATSHSRRLRIKPWKPAPAPPVALVLVSADFDLGAVPLPTLTLRFDRAIDISAGPGTQILLIDGAISQTLYDASGGAVLSDPSTVVLGLIADSGATGPDTLLTAGPNNNIVAVDDGGAWPGVTNLVLPFP